MLVFFHFSVGGMHYTGNSQLVLNKTNGIGDVEFQYLMY